ncbi:metal ABC transporter solute-binding protein, Zn/Mn family [Macrococcoides caseolyticum]|uniref:metal ABC transporter solute-binding protein, Zn/Mn family n=1 Tax=Macrococcoides caseolyticum TaxID=69966 RepID=UPI001F32C579|nr:zinc ABC transporter substrate-binding protein [Macrococcus caseolyticus]MCE4956555.1 zinc ABC transporter substrate-binding protein [Macrococcus caseolyticus]
MKKLISIFPIILLLSIMLTGCGKPNSHQLKIVTTNSILYDMTKQVVGEHANVTNIVPIGQDPHEYEVKPQDIKAITDADLIIYNGMNLETGSGWFQKALKQANKDISSKEVIEASKGIKPIYLDIKHDQSALDPHAWLSIKNGIQYVNNISHAVQQKDKSNAQKYLKNANLYKANLKELNQKYKDKFNDIDKSKRHLITSEGAFKYFARDYDISHAYIWEINTDKQGTPEQMKKAVDYVKKNHVKSLFVETSIDQRSMKSLSETTNVPIHGEVYTDSIGKKETDGDSYFKMMEHNIKVIHEGMK